jgi:hypothetical protein
VQFPGSACDAIGVSSGARESSTLDSQGLREEWAWGREVQATALCQLRKCGGDSVALLETAAVGDVRVSVTVVVKSKTGSASRRCFGESCIGHRHFSTLSPVRGRIVCAIATSAIASS